MAEIPEGSWGLLLGCLLGQQNFKANFLMPLAELPTQVVGLNMVRNDEFLRLTYIPFWNTSFFLMVQHFYSPLHPACFFSFAETPLKSDALVLFKLDSWRANCVSLCLLSQLSLLLLKWTCWGSFFSFLFWFGFLDPTEPLQMRTQLYDLGQITYLVWASVLLWKIREMTKTSDVCLISWSMIS